MRWSLFKHAELVGILLKKELRAKHVGSMLGIFWVLYSALFPLISYFLIFRFVTPVSNGKSAEEYLVFIFSGMLPWIFFQKIATDSLDLVTRNLDLLKQAIFPVEVLSVVLVGEATLYLMLQIPLLWGAAALAGVFTPSVLLAPLTILPLIIFSLGLSWMLSLIGFFIRDFKEVVSGFMRFAIFITPVLYEASKIPPKARFLIVFNPITYPIEATRTLFLQTDWNRIGYLIFIVASLGMLILGYRVIMLAKRTLGDMV